MGQRTYRTSLLPQGLRKYVGTRKNHFNNWRVKNTGKEQDTDLRIGLVLL